MNQADDKYVFHGSKDPLEIAVPKRHTRSNQDKSGKAVMTFDDVSFHATPHKWIALAYTYNPKPIKIGGKTAHYNVGVSLYDHAEEVHILGFESLEQSLQQLYGDGGYLLTFEKGKFFHAEGLGNLEVITKETIRPIKTESINNPVGELRKLGISFRFVDLGKS